MLIVVIATAAHVCYSAYINRNYDILKIIMIVLANSFMRYFSLNFF